MGNTKRHLLTGTSHMIPFIVAAGIIFSLAVMLSGKAATPETGWLADLAKIGSAGFTLFIPILGGYIAYSIADKPGLAPGAIGALLANQVGAGFLGGMAAGFLAGFVVSMLKRIKLPPALRSLGTIFLYPLCGTLIVGGIIVWGIGGPIAILMSSLTDWLNGMAGAGKAILAVILGGMTAFDMGGPINKVATLFAQTQVKELPYLMGGVGVAICTPPIGMGLATFLSRKKYTIEEREAGKAAILMGCVGITEGAIPFAVNDPIRVIPSIMTGAIVGNIIAFSLGVLNHAPWGGLIVLPVVEGRIGYIISVLAGAVVTALLVNALKKSRAEEEAPDESASAAGGIELDFEQM
ncbi:PTS fructose transporter subunit EIIC [Paenibacillus sp. HN-1]|nr:PTS fructose transporter subunit EIIC [Paenibacillus sp. CGMCC 1.18879]MBY9088234.1 PTS fructose transporter subunit EIIC [Paenibacillus sinensis]